MALVQCKECSNEVSTNAPACPKCGAPVPRQRPKSKALLFVLGGVGLLLGTCLLGVVVAAVKPGGSSAASSSAVDSARYVDMRTLLSEYSDNEVRADANFKGRYVLVDGVVNDIKRDLLNSGYLTLGTGRALEIPQVQCFFNKDQEQKAARLSKGSRISVRGQVDGLMVNVLLRDCHLP